MTSTASPSLAAFSGEIAALVAAAAPGVVAVHSRQSRASGFVWRPGLVVTSEEALADEGEISVVLPGGETVAATLAGRDPSTDIALLRVAREGLRPVAFAAAPASAGALVLAVGAAGGLPVAALGLVSLAGSAWRSLRGGDIDARVELDLRLRRASEGGVALDASGGVLGMTVFGPRRRVLVIPGATIERVASRLESHGRIARGYLGLGLQPVRLDDGAPAAMVMSVDRSGPGAAAGLRQGDAIVAWNGEAVRGVQSLLRALGPASVGTAVRLALSRGGEPAEAILTVGERPEA